MSATERQAPGRQPSLIMPESKRVEGEAHGNDQDMEANSRQATRVRVACVPCKLAKRRCGAGRPCRECIQRNMESECVPSMEVATACSYCVKRKTKCDKQRPCSRCIEHGRAEQCIMEKRFVQSDSGLSRHQTGHYNSAIVSASQKGAPSAGGVLTTLGPEPPIHFPSLLQRSALDRPPQADWLSGSGIPAAVFKAHAAWGLSAQYATKWFAHSTPRLRASLLQLFSLADIVAAAAKKPFQEEAPVSNPPQWDSDRLALYTWKMALPVRGSDIPVIETCVANDFWLGLAGVHREEYFSRLLRQDLPLYTSEIRMMCRMLVQFEKLLRWQMGVSTSEEYFAEDVIYSRFQPGWGASDSQPQAGLVVRMRIQRCSPKVGQGHATWSTVVLSPEEYDAALQQRPDVCEPLASEVLGPMTSAELMDPALDQQETLATLAASPEGRAKLDRLAECIDKRFDFFIKAVSPLRPTPLVHGPLLGSYAGVIASSAGRGSSAAAGAQD